MKTIIKLTTMIMLLTVLISFHLMAGSHIKDELNNDSKTERNEIEFNFEEEEYINDIPFNTQHIANEVLIKERDSHEQQKRPAFIGFKPGYSAEPYYEKSEINIINKT